MEGMSIRNMMKEDMTDDKNPLWRNLCMNFKPSFLLMSSKDE
jgi:hypothetical protein